jgi:putative membrane protein
MKKTKLKRAAIILIALILVFSSPLQVAGAEAEAQNAAVENVNETVYGVIKEVGTNFYSVYTMGVTSPGEYRIYGDFSAAKNLTDDVEYRLDEQGVTLLFTKTYDNFSFQVENTPRLPGTHTGGIELPFILNYYIELDNQAVIVTGGESGHARLVIEVNANEKADRSLRENMVCQIQIPISNKVFKNIKTDMSGVLIGSTYTYSGMVLPGQSAKFVIEGDVEELSLDSITFSMMPYNISDIIEETGLTSGITEMQEGSGELAAGTRALAEGLAELSTGIGQISDGAKTLNESAAGLSRGMDAYGEGLNEIVQGSSELTGGAEGIAAGLGQLDAEGSKLLEGFQQIRLGLVGMLTGNNQAGLLVEGLENIAYAIQNSPTMSRTEKEQILAGMSEIAASIPQEDYSELVESLEMYEQGLRSYVEGVTSLSAGASALSDGTARYVGGVGALADNFTQLASGVRAFRAGVSEFSEGINSLSAEVSVIPENAEKLADGQEELYKGIKTLTGALSDFTDGDNDAKAVSINSPKNDVEQVQVVLRTEAIKPKKPAKEKPDSNMTETIFERFLNLFR